MFGPWLYPPPLAPLADVIYAQKVIQNIDRQNFTLNRQVHDLARENIDLRTQIIRMNAQKYADQLSKKRNQIQKEKKNGNNIIGYSKQVLQKKQIDQINKEKNKNTEKQQNRPRMLISKKKQKVEFIEPLNNHQSLDRTYSFSSFNINKQNLSNNSQKKRPNTLQRRVQTQQAYSSKRQQKYVERKFQYLTLEQKNKHIQQKKIIIKNNQERQTQQQLQRQKKIQRQKQIQRQIQRKKIQQRQKQLQQQKEAQIQKKILLQQQKLQQLQRQLKRRVSKTQSQKKQTNKSVIIQKNQQRLNPQLSTLSARKNKEIIRIQTQHLDNQAQPRAEIQKSKPRIQQPNTVKIEQTHSELLEQENYLNENGNGNGNGYKRDNRVYLQTSSIPERTYSPISKLKSIRKSNLSGNQYYPISFNSNDITSSKKKFLNVTTYRKLDKSQPQPVIRQNENQLKN